MLLKSQTGRSTILSYSKASAYYASVESINQWSLELAIHNISIIFKSLG